MMHMQTGIVKTTLVGLSYIYLSFCASIRIGARALRHIIHSATVAIETRFIFGLWLRLSSRLLERASLAYVRVMACLQQVSLLHQLLPRRLQRAAAS